MTDSRRLHGLTSSPAYAPVTGALLGFAAVVEFVRPGEPSFELAPFGCVVVSTASLIWRRAHPVPSGLIAVVAALLAYALAPEIPVSVAVAGATGVYLLARHRVIHPALLSVVAVAGLVTATIAGRGAEPLRVVTEPLAPALGLLAAVAVGEAVYGRREAHRQRDTALARLLEIQAEQAASAERARIARELHDVVAHSVSMIAVQAETTTYTTGELPPAARDGLQQIAVSARTALAELRQLLTVLRGNAVSPVGTAPQPTLAGLDQLLAQHRSAGGAVWLHVDDKGAPLATVVELSAYRIVQEALTNARRHAPGATVSVNIYPSGDDLVVRITDDGSGTTGLETRGTGHGLIGMRERAALLGGSLSAGPSPTGGFAVIARLPIKGRTSL
ncbi:signal transduction histidine kinase [Nonomuraea thailandensis]|uniref:histidine kinase n=1 Tax=Nonomuraea thailandensis TaxID=1188745 RepID=A0A9X2JZ24_9ACTN|nr:sensor histidine kinase [Nonomuraea thailandensis]MCP2353739.1 signal transduction histidine kinase [Nonomuraea thailandensis]